MQWQYNYEIQWDGSLLLTLFLLGGAAPGPKLGGAREALQPLDWLGIVCAPLGHR